MNATMKILIALALVNPIQAIASDENRAPKTFTVSGKLNISPHTGWLYGELSDEAGPHAPESQAHFSKVNESGDYIRLAIPGISQAAMMGQVAADATVIVQLGDTTRSYLDVYCGSKKLGVRFNGNEIKNNEIVMSVEITSDGRSCLRASLDDAAKVASSKAIKVAPKYASEEKIHLSALEAVSAR